MMGDLHRLLAAVALAAGVMTVSDKARADFATGPELYAKCSKVTAMKGDFDAGYCAGYVAAIADAARRDDVHPAANICPAGTVNLAEMVDIVVPYLAAPEMRNFVEAPLLVRLALGAAFPCPTAPAPGR